MISKKVHKIKLGFREKARLDRAHQFWFELQAKPAFKKRITGLQVKWQLPLKDAWLIPNSERPAMLNINRTHWSKMLSLNIKLQMEFYSDVIRLMNEFQLKDEGWIAVIFDKLVSSFAYPAEQIPNKFKRTSKPFLAWFKDLAKLQGYKSKTTTNKSYADYIKADSLRNKISSAETKRLLASSKKAYKESGMNISGFKVIKKELPLTEILKDIGKKDIRKNRNTLSQSRKRMKEKGLM